MLKKFKGFVNNF